MTRSVALMFPGQGAQHVAMAAGLYGRDAAFTATMDEVFARLGPRGRELRSDWLGRGGAADARFDDVTRAQPLLYAVGCALGRSLLELGVRPGALIGHSVGEMVAATLSGVLDLADGVELMLDRMDTLAASPAGSMLAVAASAAELEPYLRGEVVVGAVNAPRQTLLAGPAAELARVRADLAGAGITCREARSRQAFHSPVMAPFVAEAHRAWEGVPLRAPRIPVYSARLGAPLTAGHARDPRFWAAQPAEPVLFWPALDRLLADRDALLVEAGPGQGLSTLARRHPAVLAGRAAVLPLLPARRRGPGDDREAFDRAVLRLREEGHAPHAPDVVGAAPVHPGSQGR